MTDSELGTDADNPTADKSGRGLRNAGWVLLGVLAGLGLVIGLGSMHGGPPLAGTTAMTPSTAVGVAALCYLVAAVTGIRWMAWVALPFCSGLPFLALLFGTRAWVPITAAGVVLVIIGLLRSRRATAIQALAMTGFFGVSIIAFWMEPRAGLALAGLTLAAHTGWDVWHYRRDAVVSRSVAVWCIGLDLTVGVICVMLAILG
jgi:hypothetical protein